MNIKHEEHTFVEVEKDSLWKLEFSIHEQIFILKFKLDWIIDYHIVNNPAKDGTRTIHFKCNIKTTDLNTSIKEIFEIRKKIYDYCVP